MKLITAVDLTFKSDVLLMHMIREYSDRLFTMDASTYEYYIIRDSLEIMKRALAARRRMSGPKF